MNIFQFFTDPILRAPTIGSMLMCFSAAIVGVLVFVRKRSLLGEALSHATYPGVTCAILVAGFFSLDAILAPLVLVGAFISALLGFWVIDCMEKKLKVPSDAALCAVLSLFFGIGITIASVAQASYARLYRHMLAYLYGQAATMTDMHIIIYGVLALIVLAFVVIFYKEILALSFDPVFTQTSGIAGRFLDLSIFVIVVLALVIGIRCVGVILVSAMLIAPATAARQFTNRFSVLFVLAGLFGLASGLLGIYLSVVLSEKMTEHYAVPTGPMIVLVGGGFALYACLFAPKRGVVVHYFRIVRFRGVCLQENLLKTLWRLSQGGKEMICFHEIAQRQGFSSLYLRFLLRRLIWQKAVEKKQNCYYLTTSGTTRGARIVRLHRLWEAYLVSSLGFNATRVHKSAEEMEHILTPEFEKKLTALLDNPTQDPHDQPIPAQEEVMEEVMHHG